MRITVHLADGTKREFPHEHRPGGSYTNGVRAEGEFLIVTTVWGSETWFPAEKVSHVETHPSRGGW